LIIWIDGDSCPRQVREIVARRAQKEGIKLVSVSNRPVPFPPGYSVEHVLVESGEGRADNYIEEKAVPGDLVITRDIPLAAALIQCGCAVINDRGAEFSAETIRERLSIRNFMKTLRDDGLYHSSENTFSQTEARSFAAAFDRVLCRILKNNKN
jgi:hypothetical protein